MKVTPEFLDEFRKDFNQAMDALREKYDITISLGNLTYGAENFTGKITVTMTRDPEDFARANFDEEAWKFADIGIQPGMYKRIYIGKDGKKYAILALRPRSYKQPIRSIGLEDEKMYQCGKGFIREWTDAYFAQALEPDE